MKRLVSLVCALLALSVFRLAWIAHAQGGSIDCEGLLALPADKILRISQTVVEFEHHGFLPINESVEVFQHWEEEIHALPLAAVKVGFEEVVATVFQGEVVCFDVYDPLYIRTMRVAISTEYFGSIEHEELRVGPTSILYVEEKGTGRAFQLNLGEEAVVFVERGKLKVLDGQGSTWEFGQRLHIWSDLRGFIQINSFKRGSGTRFFPQYRGGFELTVVDDDRFLVINEVSLEDYLYQVVPSEMPISWPLEALKAQAVAARTYAVAQAIYSREGYLGFHVADSTSSQVYNNQPEAASTTQAIQETAGQILAQTDGTISSTYFYSTSPRAILIDLATWKDTSGLALEGNSPWFRWKCTITRTELESLFAVGYISDVQIVARDEKGRVVELVVVGAEGKESIKGELNIRRALRPSSLKRVNDNLGPQTLLPSALFFVEQQRDVEGQLKSVTIYGGGSGHNLGMSQWGAKGMAEAGADYLSILGEYYSEARLITHSEQLRY